MRKSESGKHADKITTEHVRSTLSGPGTALTKAPALNNHSARALETKTDGRFGDAPLQRPGFETEPLPPLCRRKTICFEKLMDLEKTEQSNECTRSERSAITIYSHSMLTPPICFSGQKGGWLNTGGECFKIRLLWSLDSLMAGQPGSQTKH